MYLKPIELTEEQKKIVANMIKEAQEEQSNKEK